MNDAFPLGKEQTAGRPFRPGRKGVRVMAIDNALVMKHRLVQ